MVEVLDTASISGKLIEIIKTYERTTRRLVYEKKPPPGFWG